MGGEQNLKFNSEEMPRVAQDCLVPKVRYLPTYLPYLTLALDARPNRGFALG